ncbi:hypothetical protein HanXRQr2_Chr09g0374861 [Helianthus annuus]|uniref:Uncharacterized protein n=1 Tax=Helianthus annuus TaxID=4232 RepID=A0A9K3N7C0_HELAN|nr:hypothetical protein HanXRQr2_Chr09g0374861 [Helianthus annuus]KAJ0892060.1 hypothetical protein HanPSC8_Chr09g0361411 [Helianthus annuus]
MPDLRGLCHTTVFRYVCKGQMHTYECRDIICKPEHHCSFAFDVSERPALATGVPLLH